MFKAITRNVWLLSLVSLFNDAASELLIPVLPIYLQSIGFSVLLIGILEGLAEAAAGLSKGSFGELSDRHGRRVPFVRVGYAMSAAAKPLMAAFTAPLWIFFARTLDRFGKGVRTAARDAMLSAETTPGTKGAVFGFHRSMDTLGAVIGPAVALLYLHHHPGDYRTMFLLALFPGLVAVGLTYLLRDRPAVPGPVVRRSFFAFIGYWKLATPTYRRLVIGLLVFALFNSADAFLLLRLKTAGLSDTGVIGIYIFYNVVFALSSFPLGHLADRIGLKRVLLLGLLLFAAVYLGMVREAGLLWYGGLFLLYGLYAAATDGISKAWLASTAAPHEVATAIGFFAGFQSLCAMGASAITGALWFVFGAPVAFATTAFVALGVVGYLLFAVQGEK